MSEILIVEDDRTLNETICEILETQGYQVHSAFNGAECLEIASRKEFDLIICDINMPVMNGYETVKKFRESDQNTFVPFLFLSALSEMENLRVGMDLGADDFMKKPFEYQDLFKTVKRLLDKYSKLKEYKYKEQEFKIHDALGKFKGKIRSKLRDYNDSMERARIVQSAILPMRKELDTMFAEYGLFHSSKEIVSGDFYWAKEVDGKKLVAVGDCTGHGVPAALMTMVCSNMLSICVDWFGLKGPKEILSRVNDLVSDFMSSGNIKLSDGMDIALCSIDYENNSLLFSGAKRPLYFMSDRIIENSPSLQEFNNINHNGDSNLYRVKGGIGSIGFSESKNNIEEHSINFTKGDQIYLASDGFCDQFGGENDKKYKLKNFVDLLQKTNKKTLKEQEVEFENSFLQWKGETEQTDDVTIFFLKF
jgi:CheY-like chemotaxis protein